MNLVRGIDQQRATIAAKREGLDRLELGLEVMLADLDFLLARGATADVDPIRERMVDTSRRASSLTDQVYADLEEQRGLPIAELAARILGDDSSRNRDRIRSLLNSLKNQGRIQRFGRGRWEIIETPDEGAPPSVNS